MNPINFEKNKDLFDGNLSTGIEFTSELDRQTLNAIANNEAISDLSLPLVIGRGKVLAAGNEKKFEFKNDAAISIDGSAEGLLRVGVFNTVADVMKNIKEHDQVEIEFGELSEGEVYVLFSVGYSIKADAEGKWLFSGGSLNAGVGVARAQRMAVIKKVSKETGLRSAIQETISELRSPKLIKKPAEFDQGTWLIVQSEGSIEGKFGVQVGYDYSWVYETDTPGLNGSVGLQAKLGAQLGIGFNIAGQYAVILSRNSVSFKNERDVVEMKDAIRLQLYKQRKNGWNFAANLAASAQATGLDDFNENSLDELIKATLGIHYTQIMDGLKLIEDLQDPAFLIEKLNGFGEDLLKKITDTTDIDDYFDTAKAKLLDILDKWSKLGENAGAELWKLLDDQVGFDLDEIKEIKDKFIEIAQGNQQEVQRYIEELLGDIHYQETPFGKLLNSILPQEDIIAAVIETNQFEQLQSKAQALVNLLDIDAQIQNFHQTISEELKIDRIKEALENNDFTELGTWLTGILSDVIMDEAGNIVRDKLKEVNNFIKALKGKYDVIKKKTVEALKKEYGASLAYNYQKESERSALIDASFIINDNSLHSSFKEALNGNFNNLLTNSQGDVFLKQGMLTHRVKKDRTISLTLPYMKRDFKKINESIAKGTFIDEQDGRLFMYELDAEDTIRKSKRFSQLALDGIVKGMQRDEFHQDEALLRLSYSFKLAKNRFPTKHLEQIVEPFIGRYLQDVFRTTEEIEKKSIDQWILEMDDHIDQVNENGAKNFGRTMLNLELRIPSDIGKAWFKAPDEAKEYEHVSDAIQGKLKEVVPMYFLENEDVFKHSYMRDSLYAILAYQSLPVISEFVIKRNGKFVAHWKYNRGRNLLEQLNKTDTKFALMNSLREIVARLKYDPDPKINRLAANFDSVTTNQLSDILNRAATAGDWVNINLLSLLNIERKIISATVNAGVKLASFLDESETKPEEAVKALQEFGGIITGAFNKYSGISIIASKKDYTRYIGPELFVAVARALDPEIDDNTQGTLELLVLKRESDFNITSYLDGKVPEIDDLIISQKIMDLA